jgi:hypothetical protein
MMRRRRNSGVENIGRRWSLIVTRRSTSTHRGSRGLLEFSPEFVGNSGISGLIPSSLAAGREGKRVQEREEVGATFIGAEGWHIWQGINGIEGGEGIARAEVTAKTFGRRLKMLRWPDSWVPLVSEGERRNAYRFGGKEKMGRRPFSGLGRKVSPGPLLYFFSFFSSFSCSISYFFHNFCKFAPN